MTAGYNFSERVLRVLHRAQDEARALRHEYIGTEHLLLSLVREQDGVACALLQAHHVDAVAVDQRIRDVVKLGKSASPSGNLPYTSRAKRVLELSMSEARGFNHGYVGSEHLLLGILCEEKGIAAQLLTHLGLKLDDVRAETLTLLGTSAPPEAHAVPANNPEITIAIRVRDGSMLHKTFHDVSAAIAFLKQHE